MFDPYHKWLGIPGDQRPPTCYQLLAISPAEADPEVIEAAAIRQSAYVRNFQAGPHAADAARVLGEIARARDTLLDPAKRKDYDSRYLKSSSPRRRRVSPTAIVISLVMLCSLPFAAVGIRNFLPSLENFLTKIYKGIPYKNSRQENTRNKDSLNKEVNKIGNRETVDALQTLASRSEEKASDPPTERSEEEKESSPPAGKITESGVTDDVDVSCKNAALSLVEQGWVHLEKAEHGKTIEKFTEAIEICPDWYVLYLWRGDLYNWRGEKEKAIADYSDLIRLAPKEINVKLLKRFTRDPFTSRKDFYYRRGLVYQSEREFDKAIDDFTSAIEVDPLESFSYSLRANLYRIIKDYESAIKDLTEAIHRNARDAQAFRQRARIYVEKRDFERALEDFTAALKFSSMPFYERMDRGRVYEELDRIDLAIEDYTEATRLDPKAAFAYYRRSWALARRGDLILAEADRSKALGMQPGLVRLDSEYDQRYPRPLDWTKPGDVALAEGIGPKNGSRPPGIPHNSWDQLNKGAAIDCEDYLRLPPNQEVTTKESYAGPMDIYTVARTQKDNIRLGAFNGAGVIFNWEVNLKELYVARPDGNENLESGSPAKVQIRPLTPNVWHKLHWRITNREMLIWIDQKLVFKEKKRYDLSAKRPVRIRSVGSIVDFKYLIVNIIK